MSSYLGNGAKGYQVSYHPAALQALKRLPEALSGEPAMRFAAALRSIDFRLRKNPHVFGEYRYPLRHMKLAMRAGAIRPLHVTYGVPKERSLVFVMAFRLLPDRDSVTP